MNSPPQLRGVFSSPNNVSNFKPASRPGEPRRLNFGPDSPQRVHKPVPSKKKSAGRRRRNRRKKRTRRRRRRSRSHRRKRGSGGIFSRRAASTAAPADLRPVPLHRERIPRRIRHGHDDAALRDRSRALLSPIGAAKEEAADLHTVPLHRERIPPSSMIAFSAPLPPHGQRHALLSPTDGGRRRRRTRRRRRRR